jgi:hypothetical protein
VAITEAPSSHDDVLCYLSSLSKTALRSKSLAATDIAEAIGGECEDVRWRLTDLVAEGALDRVDGYYTVLVPSACGSRCAARKPQAGSRPTEGGTLRNPATPVYSSHPADVKGLSGFDLASRFRGVIEKAAAAGNLTLGPDPFNHGALAGAFARWRRDGVESTTIAAMIDAFAVDLRRHRRAGRPIWRLFLAARTNLFEKVAASVERAALTADDWAGDTVEQVNTDRSYWMGES